MVWWLNWSLLGTLFVSAFLLEPHGTATSYALYIAIFLLCAAQILEARKRQANEATSLEGTEK